MNRLSMCFPLPRRHALLRRLALGIVLTLATTDIVSATESPRVVVFAAASATEAVSAMAERFAELAGAEVVRSFAASSVLARQIESGAPADVFISADARWMDYLAARGLIDDASRCDLLRNSLVLIAPRGSDAAFELTPGAPLSAALDGGRLAMGDPDHVPAGLYGRQALERLGVWHAVEGRIVRSASVRAALVLVARGEAAFGIVYATDAMVTDEVRVVAVFPAGSHDAIVYPAARVNGAANPAADAFLAFLVSPEGRALAIRFGFLADPLANPGANQEPTCSP
jgi:molybdate transport system substrate-binding protein